MTTPFVSIIVLNYFGEKIITGVLETLENIDYPKEKFEVLVVDNGSTDNSIQILKEFEKRFQNLRLIPLEKNFGFSKGNNIGIKQAKGEYVVLLNNDCIVDRNWLRELVKTSINHPNVFAVNSKILLYPKYLNLSFDIDSYLIPQYSWLSKSNILAFSKKRIYLTLAKKERGSHCEVPFDPKEDREIEIKFIFNCGNDIKSKNLKSLINLHAPGAEIVECNASKNEASYKIKINLENKEIEKQTFSKIQNAGIMPFQDGYARDIGGIIKDNRHYFEHDRGQYSKEVEVYAACGAAVMMDKRVLEKIGYLDETFFMYYEDVEISERARLSGYKIYFSPKAIVRHLHALSSGEGSNFFVFNVEKGRLLHVLFNFPMKVFFAEFFKVILILIYGIAKAIFHLRHLRSFSKKPGHEKPSYELKLQKLYVLIFFIIRFPWLLLLRQNKNSLRKSESVMNNYGEITSGRWYFE